jgi:FixJ family two-component response regulator|tara:strand:- start:532 stop:828 length:297 start_codon:yes stop_codon:yes gene_type:complete
MATNQDEIMAMANQRSVNEEIGPDSAQSMMQPDPDIQVVIMSRLESLSPEELQLLDRVIDGQTAAVLLKILPELGELIDMSMSRKNAGGAQMGALGGM